jgi:hypothetical protein
MPDAPKPRPKRAQTFYSVYSAKTAEDVAAAVADYRRWLLQPEQAHLRAAVRAELSGKDLACWCPLDQPCHADVLLDLANRSVVPE